MDPYLALLRVGFTLPRVLPRARCALTAPFHPYRRRSGLAVSFLWHFPWTRAPQALPGTLSYGARTFLPPKRATAWPAPSPQECGRPGEGTQASSRPSASAKARW